MVEKAKRPLPPGPKATIVLHFESRLYSRVFRLEPMSTEFSPAK